MYAVSLIGSVTRGMYSIMVIPVINISICPIVHNHNPICKVLC